MASPCADLAFDPVLLAELDRTVAGGVAQARPPGAVLWVEQGGRAAVRVHGLRALHPAPEPLDADTVYDAASLTKVVVTAPLVARLLAQGALALDAPLHALLDGVGEAARAVTLRHLLTHTSGLPASLPSADGAAPWAGTEAAFALARQQVPTHTPGSFFRYSDINFILLGEIVERAAGQPLDALAQAWIFGPLGLRDTGFRPLQRIAAERIAPTEVLAGRALRGEVHDPTARAMGGVAGHAGLFSTAADLARYARCLLAGGVLDGQRILDAESVALMWRDVSPPGVSARRGLGWDLDSPYSRPRGTVWGPGSVGHTGFTGCVLWVDPASRAFYVFLSNRVHPSVGESIVPLYEAVGTLAARLTAPQAAASASS